MSISSSWSSVYSENFADFNFNQSEDDTFEEENLVEYCRSFINIHFYGENSSDTSLWKSHGVSKQPRKFSLSFTSSANTKISDSFTVCSTNIHPDSLGTLLKIFHLMLTCKTEQEEKLSGTEDVIFQYLIIAAKLRKKPDEKMNTCFKRLVNDCQRFLTLYNADAASQHEIAEDHWGSCQQLRSGKVIADHIGGKHSPLDPIFGVLMCPYAGQMSDLSRMDRDQYYPLINIDSNTTEAESYHRIMYDSFEYLEKYHNIGPGKDYLGGYTLLYSEPVAAETTSRLFWERHLNRMKEDGLQIEVKYY